jgi:RHS repeat-associated protein
VKSGATSTSLWKQENFYCTGVAGSCTSNNGNVIWQRLTAPKTGGSLVLATAYGYDGVNRITSAAETGAGTPWSQSYSYTADGSTGQYGNLTQTGDGLSSSLTCHTYLIPDPEHPGTFKPPTNQCTDAGIVYDSAGNLTTYGTRTLTYDAENRQTSLSDGGSYEYDGEGRRVKKVADGVTTVYVYDAMGKLAAEYASAAPTNQPDCTTCYLTADHLGSTRMVTDAEGAVKRRTDYHPFGGEISPDYGDRNSVDGYAATDESNPKFTGKQRDYESGLGLDYFGARYFSGAQGRFTSPDEFVGGAYEVGGARPGRLGPLPYADIMNPQSLNKYSYAYNNPLRYIDPDGHEVVLSGSTQDQSEEMKRPLANASKKGEAALFKTVTGKNGRTNLVLDKEAAAKFQGPHSKGYNMLVQTIGSKNTVTVEMSNFDSQTSYQGNNATVSLGRNVAGIDRAAPMRDPGGNIVPNPFSIIAGHEILGHGRLHLLGVSDYAEGPGSKVFQVENQLRKEQGLPPRPDNEP